MKIIELHTPITLEYALQVEKEKVAKKDKEAVAIIYTGVVQNKKEATGLYTRKSQESEERQIQSIESQLIWGFTQVKNSDLQLKVVIIETKSAKEPGREGFDHLMGYFSKPKLTHVISWKLDRLSRNPVDGGIIQYLLQKGKLSKVITNDREYTVADSGLLMSVENGMNTEFVMGLVKNVARGMKSKAEKGGCVGFTPLGYINNKLTREAEVDETKAPFIKEIYSLRASGTSYNEIVRIMSEKGLKGKHGGKITKTGIESILKNPFYIGLQRLGGKLHNAIHEKLVSVETWEKVNEKTRGYKKHSQEVEFPLKGIVKNYHDGKNLLALWKKKKYVYYSTHSTDKNVINMNQNHIIEAFDSMVGQYCISEKLKPFIREKIKECFESYYEDIKKKKKAFEVNLRDLNKKSQKLLDLVCNETIAEDIYKEKENDIILEKQKIQEELGAIQDIDTVIIQEAYELVELLTNLDSVWKNANNDKKLRIIKIIVVELFVDTKKQLYVQENELFEHIKCLGGYSWQGS